MSVALPSGAAQAARAPALVLPAVGARHGPKATPRGAFAQNRRANPTPTDCRRVQLLARGGAGAETTAGLTKPGGSEDEPALPEHGVCGVADPGSSAAETRGGAGEGGAAVVASAAGGELGQVAGGRPGGAGAADQAGQGRPEDAGTGEATLQRPCSDLTWTSNWLPA
jgi:hypothetical protein